MLNIHKESSKKPREHLIKYINKANSKRFASIDVNAAVNTHENNKKEN